MENVKIAYNNQDNKRNVASTKNCPDVSDLSEVKLYIKKITEEENMRSYKWNELHELKTLLVYKKAKERIW